MEPLTIRFSKKVKNVCERGIFCSGYFSKRPMRRLTVKENHIGQAVRIPSVQTDRHSSCYFYIMIFVCSVFNLCLYIDVDIHMNNYICIKSKQLIYTCKNVICSSRHKIMHLFEYAKLFIFILHHF